MEISQQLFPDVGIFSNGYQNINFWNNKIGQKLQIQPVLCLVNKKYVFNNNERVTKKS